MGVVDVFANGAEVVAADELFRAEEVHTPTDAEKEQAQTFVKEQFLICWVGSRRMPVCAFPSFLQDQLSARCHDYLADASLSELPSWRVVSQQLSGLIVLQFKHANSSQLHPRCIEEKKSVLPMGVWKDAMPWKLLHVAASKIGSRKMHKLSLKTTVQISLDSIPLP